MDEKKRIEELVKTLNEASKHITMDRMKLCQTMNGMACLTN